jgi:hypothetical protein
MVTLKNTATGKDKAFDPLHAENILRRQQAKGSNPSDRWELPDDSPFTFEKNELRSNAGVRGHKKAGKKAKV